MHNQGKLFTPTSARKIATRNSLIILMKMFVHLHVNDWAHATKRCVQNEVSVAHIQVNDMWLYVYRNKLQVTLNACIHFTSEMNAHD